tara:strand:- start:497 stop:1390 length:894 start_codon:yes stop_codon:yes gene_type:complete
MKSDFLDDYFKKKKIKYLRGLLFLSLIILLLFFLTKFTSKSNDFLARVEVHDVILDNKNLLNKIELLKSEEELKGIIVSINSPGGTIVASQELYKAFKSIGKKIPIVVSMKDVAASGGYMVSLASNKIYCYEGTLTGSIGVILQSANIENLLSKLGIQPVIYKSGSLKAVPNPLEKVSNFGDSNIKTIIQNMFDQFLGLVSEERKLSSQTKELISDGRVFTGLQAKEINLVDEIGTESDAIEWLKEFTNSPNDIKIIDMNKENKISSYFNISFLKNFFKENLIFTNGIFALWYPYYE